MLITRTIGKTLVLERFPRVAFLLPRYGLNAGHPSESGDDGYVKSGKQLIGLVFLKDKQSFR